jgi:predicted transcriptional regulator
MNKCKYCGQETMFKMYCSPECLEAVEGFDRKLSNERYKKNIVSLQHVEHELSDGGAGAKKTTGRLDAEAYEYIMRIASDIHPKLPGALIQMENGATQSEAARLVGLDKGDLSNQLSRLRKLLKSSKL